ncbi:MAG: hypothetical protein JXR19_10530 [Bacteroidia bacterium]
MNNLKPMLIFVGLFWSWQSFGQSSFAACKDSAYIANSDTIQLFSEHSDEVTLLINGHLTTGKLTSVRRSFGPFWLYKVNKYVFISNDGSEFRCKMIKNKDALRWCAAGLTIPYFSIKSRKKGQLKSYVTHYHKI